MSHSGRSGTLLDPPNNYVSNPHAAALYWIKLDLHILGAHSREQCVPAAFII